MFLLTTQSLENLLPTVVSRVRTVHFARLSAKEIDPLLDGCSEDDRVFLIRLAQGAPGLLNHLKNNPDALRFERVLHTDAFSFWETTRLAERLRLLKPLLKKDEQSRNFLLHLALALREIGVESHLSSEKALRELSRGLQTNVHRELLVQRFALDASSTSYSSL